MPSPTPDRIIECAAIEHRLLVKCPAGGDTAPPMPPARSWRSVLGPLLPLLGLATLLLALLSLARLGHTACFARRVAASSEWLWLFPIGVRMDSVLISMVLTLPALALLLGARWHERLRVPFILYGTLVTGVIAFMELATVQFLVEFDHRPDRLFWEYLAHPREVMETVIKSAWPSLLVVIVLLPLLLWGSARWHAWLWNKTVAWPWGLSLAMLPLIAGLLVLGIRGTLSHRPVNPSTAAFSNENLLNQLALNSTYSGAYALYSLRHEEDTAAAYGKLDQQRILCATRRASGLPDSAFTVPELPTLHRVAGITPRPRPLNVVILLEESLGGQFVGCLGGLPLTPNIDALSREGLLLTRHYATGTRTVRGIEAVLCGFLPSPSRSVVKLGMSQNGFFSGADVLRRQGYETLFFYGGESHFDNMRSFFQGNGFSRIIDQPLFIAPVFSGVWGVSDEDLVRRAIDDLDALGDQPFFAFMLSTTNHVPFEFPDGRIELYEQPKQTQHNAIKYADYAIGEFFRLARKKSFFANTVFLVVADHNIRTVGDSLVPVSAFRIPALLIGPGFTPGTTYDRVCSQLDLLPTILPRLGLELDTPMLGHDLLARPADAPGRAIMQFGDNHAYRLGDRVVVHQPKKPAVCFTLDAQDHMTLTDEAWPDLIEEALAHALLPGKLYQQRAYRLPTAAAH